MGRNPELIVMLTHHDRTVAQAAEIFAQCVDSRAKFWGFKEEGLPLPQMQQLFGQMKDCGKTTVLEVVAYTEEACLAGAQKAAACGCDILMGTAFFTSVLEFCRDHGIKYMPFVGQITGRPSVLEGEIDEMIRQARCYLDRGVYGIDLLAYRYTGDASALIRQFVAQVDAPVCLAGSVNSVQRLAEIKDSGAWAFTIGGAFFENRFDGTFVQQIDKVCAYMDA